MSRSDEVSLGETIFPQDINAIRKDATASGILLAHQQLGALAIGTQPTNTHTITLTVNGTAIVLTAVSSIGSTAGNFLIGATDAATLANLMSLLANPGITNATQVALTNSNQQLLSYLDFALVGTTITICSLNSTMNGSLTSFACTTTITSATYTAQAMQLFVEPGVCYVNGTEVYFAGGSTPTVTAPSSHPRIDVLTIDSTGTLAWTTGTENASPTVPAYPANKLPICELLNVTGETSLLDNTNFNAAQGWIQNDVRPFMSTGINLASIPDAMIPATDATYDLGSLSKEWNNVYAKAGIFVNGVGVAIAKFGGSGADGALSISSGTTTVALGSVPIFTKNYTSISITGTTGALAFSGPATNGTIIVLKSQGNVTITSSATAAIDVSGLTAGSPATSFGSFATQSTTGHAGIFIPTHRGKSVQVGCGAAGQGGSAGFFSGTPGAGGNGAGAIYIECAGALNFGASATIKANGANGVAGTSAGGSGGGGGAGTVLIVYNTLTTNAGTIVANGGNGGTGGGGGSGQANGGIEAFGGLAGTSSTDYGTSGSGGGGNGGGAGGGGTGGTPGTAGGGGGGSWAIEQNTEFA